jgi:hypothetical protein
MQPKCLTQQPFAAVSSHCVSMLSRHAETGSNGAWNGRQSEQQQVPVAEASAFVVDLLEIGRSP